MKSLKCIAISVIFIMTTVSSKAQSIVYVFNDWGGGTGTPSCTLTIDGKDAGSMFGKETKRIECSSWNGFLTPAITYSKAVKPCIINKEGKTIFKIFLEWAPVIEPNSIMKMADECQLDLVDGETYYIHSKRKGITGIQFVEIKAKTGEKLLKNKKYEHLPNFVLE